MKNDLVFISTQYFFVFKIKEKHFDIVHFIIYSEGQHTAE